MIVIINGSVGVGKTSVSWALLEKFEKSIMLDGDHIGAVHPFEIYDDDRIEYLYDTLVHLIQFHHSRGYSDFVINYVFESPESLNSLVKRLAEIIPEVHCFRLTCSLEEQKKRILSRNNDDTGWELNRIKELNEIQRRASAQGFIGELVDTTGNSSPRQTAAVLWEKISKK